MLAATLLVGFQQMLHKDYRETAYLESYGSLVASQLARLGQDAMVREDAIALNVLAEQVAAEPAIVEIEIYSMDGATLASYSKLQTNVPVTHREFTRPIQLADATAGFVKVVVAADAMVRDRDNFQVQEWLRQLAALALSTALTVLLASWLTGSLKRQTGQTRIEDPKGTTEESENDVEAVASYYFLLVNLFNGNDMQATRRDALMASASQHTNAVAELYTGTAQRISSTAIAILFDATENAERSFEVACAALVLARLGNQPGGARYRYSLQQLEAKGSATYPLTQASAESCEDALLHAALAEDNAIALSARFAHQLPRPERLELTSEHSLALSALHIGATNDYFLLSSANPTTLAMLERQVEALRVAAPD